MDSHNYVDTAYIDRQIQDRINDAVSQNKNISMGQVRIPTWLLESTPLRALTLPL